MDYYHIPSGAFTEVKGTAKSSIGLKEFSSQIYAEIDALGQTTSRFGYTIPNKPGKYSKSFTLVIPYGTEIDPNLVTEASNRGIAFLVSYPFVNIETGGVVFSAPAPLKPLTQSYGDRKGWNTRDPKGIQFDWEKAIPSWGNSNETENQEW